VKRRVLCVVNPRAGNKAGASVLAQLKPMMKDASELLEFHVKGEIF
jgi:hypothetical protein